MTLQIVFGSVFCATVVTATSALPASVVPWRQVLEGRWVGAGAEWNIDQDAMQVNRDPARPFAWESLWIVSTEGRMIVFDIGRDRFIGLLGVDTLTISQAGQLGSVTLVRERGRGGERIPAPIR